MPAKTLMIQGTGSSVGKSLLVTALCRIFKRKGLSVSPFKSQNMSLNSFITEDGHEMGRAQVAQAEAAGLAPSSLMNPVLLKPCGDKTSQVIVNGAVRTTMGAREYYAFRPSLRMDILQSFMTLAGEHDLILIEGAGSPAEINLRENDIANMGMAAMADAPVILVGDIDRGGVFASLYGTVKLLEPHEQRRIRGCVINKFRGDGDILEPGLRLIEYLLAKPVLGVLPVLDVRIDEEDSLTERLGLRSASPDDLDIAVVRLPRLSNFTDFAVFDIIPGAALRYVEQPASLGQPDLLILPGTKNTPADMRFLRDSGFAGRIEALHAAGTAIIGICGGFQMLGKSILDPHGVEGEAKETAGLGLLDVHTVFMPHKRTTQTGLTLGNLAASRGMLRGMQGTPLSGYEIHMGYSTAAPGANVIPLGARDDGTPEGAVSPCGRVMGTYLHGCFDNISFARALVGGLRSTRGLPELPPQPVDEACHSYADYRQIQYDRLADQVEACLDMDALERIIFSRE